MILHCFLSADDDFESASQVGNRVWPGINFFAMLEFANSSLLVLTSIASPSRRIVSSGYFKATRNLGL